MKRTEIKQVESEIEDYPLETFASEIAEDFDEYTEIDDFNDQFEIESDYGVKFKDSEEWEQFYHLLNKEYEKFKKSFEKDLYKDFSNKEQIIHLLKELIDDSYNYSYLKPETLLQIILTNGNK